jgi:hypothetical protein
LHDIAWSCRLHNKVIETDFAEFVDQNVGVRSRRVGEYASQEAGFAAAEETREQGYR